MGFLRKPRCCSPLLLVLLLLVAAPANAISYRVHQSLLAASARPVPAKVVLLPMDVKVSEITAGGVVEEEPDWTKKAIANIEQGLRKYDETNPQLQIVASPQLTSAELETTKEHLALYNIVAGNAYWTTTFGGSGWRHKRERFDYTLGTGLAFLKARTGADAGLVVIGRHQIATGGRVAASVLAALFGGVIVPTSSNFLTMGVVDFASGDILWLSYTPGARGKEMRDADETAREVRKMMEDFPGLEGYRKFIAR